MTDKGIIALVAQAICGAQRSNPSEPSPDDYEAAQAALAVVESGLRSLLKGEHSSLTIGFNEESALNYESVAEWMDHRPDMMPAKFISPEEEQAARDQNSMWGLHWYPDTPVGFYAIAASSLTAVLDAALQGDFDE